MLPWALYPLDLGHNFAAVAEDTWFDVETPAKKIAQRIRDVDKQYSLEVAIANAERSSVFSSIRETEKAAAISAIVDNSDFEKLTDLGEIAASIDAFEQSLVSPQWAAVNKRFPPPQIQVLGTVMNVLDFGVFVEVEVGISGLIPARRLPAGFRKMDQFSPGERIIVEVVSVQPFQRKIDLRYIRAFPSRAQMSSN